MIKICLQSGHDGKAGAGAPNESATNKRITDRLSSILRERGFDITQTNYYGFNDPNVTQVDFALFLALHCDMDYPNDNGSGFADYPEPSTDGATAESQRITALINQTFFKETGITFKSRSNANTRYYYMWQYLTAKTPCSLIEMGQSIDPHDSVLLANTDLIANALGRAICKAFNVPFDLVVTPPIVIDPSLALKEEIKNLKIELESANKTIESLKTDNVEALALVRVECEKKMADFKASLLKIINS
jgi:hypothetical protein